MIEGIKEAADELASIRRSPGPTWSGSSRVPDRRPRTPVVPVRSNRAPAMPVRSDPLSRQFDQVAYSGYVQSKPRPRPKVGPPATYHEDWYMPRNIDRWLNRVEPSWLMDKLIRAGAYTDNALTDYVFPNMYKDAFPPGTKNPRIWYGEKYTKPLPQSKRESSKPTPMEGIKMLRAQLEGHFPPVGEAMLAEERRRQENRRMARAEPLPQQIYNVRRSLLPSR